MAILLLDGPLGTELSRRGVDTTGRAWSAAAIDAAPQVISQIHADYAAAGATLHTTNTFRTTQRAFGDGWQAQAIRAVQLARAAVPAGHRIAGAIAPLEDCYRPDLAPADAQAEHALLAGVLSDAGVDLLLCETFPHGGEALDACRAALATGRETWLALTAGPDARLLAPEALAQIASTAADLGVSTVLVNCVAATRVGPFVEALARRGLRFGVYANAGDPADGIGLGGPPDGPARYAALAAEWVAAGAQVIGGCCGTTPAHVAAVRDRLWREDPAVP